MMQRMPTHCHTSTCTAASYLIGQDGYCAKCSQRRKTLPQQNTQQRGRPGFNAGPQQRPEPRRAGRSFSDAPNMNTSRPPSHERSLSGTPGTSTRPYRPVQRSSSVGRMSRANTPPRSSALSGAETPPQSLRSSSLGRASASFSSRPSFSSRLSAPYSSSRGGAETTRTSSLKPQAGAAATGPQRRFLNDTAYNPRSNPQTAVRPSPRVMKVPERPVVGGSTNSQLRGPPAAAGKHKGGQCKTPGCVSSTYLVQLNGFCTACNDEKKGPGRHRPLTTPAAGAAVVESPRYHRQPSQPPQQQQPVTTTTATGTAFGGRLEFIMTPKGKEVGRQGSRPTEELVDYQLLRLKFLLNKAVGQKVDPLEVFQHFDTDGSGGIDTEEFTNGLQRLGIYLTEAEYTALLNRFLDADGTIPYQRFLGVLGLENGGPQTSSEPFKDSPSAVSTQALVSDELDKILKKIHEEIQTLADRGSGRKPNFKKAFAHFDKDGGGEIDLAEFMEGLSDIGIELKAKQMSQIAKVFDSDGQGTIDYEEFAKFSEAPSATEAVQHTKVFVAKKQKAASKSKFSEFELVDMVQNIHKEINRLARTKGKTPNFKAVFSEMDHDGGGKVDISEFLEGLGNLGFDLSLKQAVQVAQVFDSDGTGSIEAGEFVAFCEASDVAEAVRISKTLKEKRKKTKRVPKKPHEKKPPKPVDTVALTKTVKNIHEEINRLAKSKYGTPDFRKVFAGMDHDGGGQLETTEFLEGLAEMGFIMKLKQVAQISAIFDSQGDGTVDYKEFVAFCEAKDAVEIMVQVEKRSKNRK